ncbi:MAG: hypothetical protein JY451_08455 [Erythrobacter sp.]|nr:MAG: hypothetical protein JY451_08455 [Erythrobacter sp.]
MKFSRMIAIAVATLGFAFASGSVAAQTDSYRVEANATHTTELTVCNPVVEVRLNGDDDTDLDYVIRNSRGEIVHSDYGFSDETVATLRRRPGVECENFTVETRNLGNIWNLMDVSMNTLQNNDGASVSTASYRVEANGVHRVDLSICNPQVRIDIAGDGDTDLDYVITNSRGATAHSDYGLTDRTSAVLYRASGVECEEFDLTTTNLGGVYNLYQVSLTDLVYDSVAPVAASGKPGGVVLGSNDGNNRDVSIVNATGETIMYLYWSNVAASGWGEDRLGSGVLAAGQNWNVTVDDASGACRFDFKARLASGREIEQRNVDVCAVYTIQFN